MLMMSLCASGAQAQTVLKGTVHDSSGEPLVGVTVVMNGNSKTATVTDIDGRYSVNVGPKQKADYLSFSYVGMKTKEVAAKNGMKVQLQSDDQQLEEVVVTAMGITRSKKSLGYASQDLKEGELSTSGTSSLANAIQGKLTGVSLQELQELPHRLSSVVPVHLMETTSLCMSSTECLSPLPQTSTMMLRQLV